MTIGDEQRLCREFAALCRRLYERHLVSGIGGNASVRSDETVLVTPTGSCLGRVAAGDLVKVAVDGTVVGAGTPSKETAVHLAIYERRPNVNCVLHTHSPGAIAASSLLHPGPDALAPVTPGYAYYAWPLPLVRFSIPGLPQTTPLVVEALADHRAILMQNHGLVVVGRTPEEAMDITEEIEEACVVYVMAGAKGTAIPSAVAKEIRQSSGA